MTATADWFGEAAPARAPAPARRRQTRTSNSLLQARPRRRARQRRITGGIAWIAAFAILLAGVVAVNVAVLRANVAVDRLDKQQLQLQAENAALASQVSSAGAAIRIERTARRFGLVPADAADTTYLDLDKR